MKKKKKSVWVSQSVRILIFCLIVICTIFVPFTISDSGITLSLTKLPLIGNNHISSYLSEAILGLQNLTGLSKDIMIYISYVYEYFLFVFYGILLLNIIFALLLIITKNNVLRTIFRIFSLIFVILHILILIISISYIVCWLYIVLSSGNFQNILPVIKENGFIYFLALAIFSGLMIRYQFYWFESDVYVELPQAIIENNNYDQKDNKKTN